jgi:hypothetical protein
LVDALFSNLIDFGQEKTLTVVPRPLRIKQSSHH